MTEYQKKALTYAENHGIIEYDVNGKLMEYMSFYGQDEGWWYVVVDLDSMREIHRAQAFPRLGIVADWLGGPKGGGLSKHREGGEMK